MQKERTTIVTIFMDESGYTGPDLLNSAQPIFSLASLKYTEQECEDFKIRLFRGVRLPELKYKLLVEHHDKKILKFLEELAESPEKIKLEVIHKQYLLVSKFVDLVINRAAMKDGFDLHVQGSNIALANALYIGLSALSEQGFFEDLLKRLQKMMRKLDEVSYHDFYSPLLKEKYKQPLQNFIDEPLDYLMWYIQKAHDTCGYEALKEIKDYFIALKLPSSGPLDIGLVSALNLIEKWRRDITGDIELFYDKNSQMAQARYIWNILMNPYLPPGVVGYDALRFPIGVYKTHLENSKNWVGLQLADIVAGATRDWATWKFCGEQKDDAEYREGLDKVIPAFTRFEVKPTTQVTPEELGLQDRDTPPSSHYLDTLLNAYLRMRRLQDMGIVGFDYRVDFDQ